MNSAEVFYETEHIHLKWLNLFYEGYHTITIRGIYDFVDPLRFNKLWRQSKAINKMVMRGVVNEWILRKHNYEAYIQWLPLELIEQLSELVYKFWWWKI